MIKFFKMHGIGNDYIFIDNTEQNLKLDFSSLAKKLSKRRFSVGSDGLVVINKCSEDGEMQIYNSDGTRAKMCGNATRCVAFYLGKKLNKNIVKIKIDKKILTAKILSTRKSKAKVEVNMGKAKYMTCLKRQVTNYEPFHIASIGNKHCVVFSNNLTNFEKIGKKINDMPEFGDGINVEFVKVLSRKKIHVKVYERGSGVTLACGSGACACAYVANHLGLCDKQIQVVLDGGNLDIVIKDDDDVVMKGECEYIYSGEIK